MITAAALGAAVVGMVMFMAGFAYLVVYARDFQGDGAGRLRFSSAFMVTGVLLAGVSTCVVVIAR